MAIIGISSIHLLKTFIAAGEVGMPVCGSAEFIDAMAAHGAAVAGGLSLAEPTCTRVTPAGVMWQSIIHGAFILSAMGIAYTDKLMTGSTTRREHAAAGHRSRRCGTAKEGRGCSTPAQARRWRVRVGDHGEILRIRAAQAAVSRETTALSCAPCSVAALQSDTLRNAMLSIRSAYVSANNYYNHARKRAGSVKQARSSVPSGAGRRHRVERPGGAAGGLKR